MTASVVCVMTEQGRLDRALESVLAAGSALRSAIKHEEGDKGIELLDVASYVDLAGNFLMAAGAFPEQWEITEGALSAHAAATRADALLRQAAQQFPRGSALDEDEFEALIEVWGAIRGLGGGGAEMARIEDFLGEARAEALALLEDIAERGAIARPPSGVNAGGHAGLPIRDRDEWGKFENSIRQGLGQVMSGARDALTAASQGRGDAERLLPPDLHGVASRTEETARGYVANPRRRGRTCPSAATEWPDACSSGGGVPGSWRGLPH